MAALSTLALAVAPAAQAAQEAFTVASVRQMNGALPFCSSFWIEEVESSIVSAWEYSTYLDVGPPFFILSLQP